MLNLFKSNLNLYETFLQFFFDSEKLKKLL